MAERRRTKLSYYYMIQFGCEVRARQQEGVQSVESDEILVSRRVVVLCDGGADQTVIVLQAPTLRKKSFGGWSESREEHVLRLEGLRWLAARYPQGEHAVFHARVDIAGLVGKRLSTNGSLSMRQYHAPESQEVC